MSHDPTKERRRAQGSVNARLREAKPLVAQLVGKLSAAAMLIEKHDLRLGAEDVKGTLRLAMMQIDLVMLHKALTIILRSNRATEEAVHQ